MQEISTGKLLNLEQVLPHEEKVKVVSKNLDPDIVYRIQMELDRKRGQLRPRANSNIPADYILGYFRRDNLSLFRRYQTAFVAKHASGFRGNVIELGGKRKHQYRHVFSNASSFTLTNICGDFDQYLDVTQMTDLADESVDGYLCVSVLEHIREFPKALSEIQRTLKTGGNLIIIVPFIFRVHLVDYWRFSLAFFQDYFSDYDVIDFAQMGGALSVTAELLKPTNVPFPITLLGWFAAIIGRVYDKSPNITLGYAIYLRKRRRADVAPVNIE